MSFTNAEILLWLNSAMTVAVLGGIARMLIKWGQFSEQISSLNAVIKDLRFRVARLEAVRFGDVSVDKGRV